MYNDRGLFDFLGLKLMLIFEFINVYFDLEILKFLI